MKDFRYMAIVAAAALGLAVAGCGSSSDDDTASTPTVTPPTQAELDAAEKKAADEKARADALQAEKDRDQAAADVKVAKALFGALKMPRAISGDPETGGETTGQTDHARTAQVTIPALGKADEMGMFKKEDGTTLWSAVVHTTEGAARTRLLAEVLAPNSNYNGRTLTLGTDADRNIKSSSFPQESGTRSYPAGNREFSGTYMDAGGKYACTGGTCTARWTTTGIVLSAGWSFTPDDNARATIPDSAFQSYGWWLQKNADGTMDAGPVHFTAGTMAATGVTALEGSAKYTGSAAGKYAIYSGAFSDKSEAGHFDADVTLTANFGDDSDQGRVSGMIDNFMTEAGAKGDWSVRLNASGDDASDGLNDTGAFAGMTAWTIGTVTSTETGRYSGNLYDSTGQDGVPHEAGGTFEAPFEGGVGRMIGAFGATRSKQQ